jgi:uncharacterized protein YbjT (DUF2867 family)
MENFTTFIPQIKSAGIIGSPLKSDSPIDMVATKDIAYKAAEFLDSLKFAGQSIFEFVGPQGIPMAEATKVLGKAIGKPDLKYVQISFAQAEKELLAAGMKPQITKSILEMYKAFNDGTVKATQQLTPEHRGKTTIEEFAKNFAQIYQESTPKAARKS